MCLGGGGGLPDIDLTWNIKSRAVEIETFANGYRCRGPLCVLRATMIIIETLGRGGGVSGWGFTPCRYLRPFSG